jgi:hypothetical protein
VTTLAQYEEARAALAKATRIDEVMEIRVEVEHIKLYAKQIKDQTLLADASAFQLRVERRLGEVLLAAKETGQVQDKGRPKKGNAPGYFSPAKLAELGVDKNLSARAQKRATISEQAFENIIEGIRHRIAAGASKIINEKPMGNRATMGSRIEPKDSLDYFPTPPWATRTLVEIVLPQLGIRAPLGFVWEPACGEGHMAEVLAEYAHEVLATDVHDYGYGRVLNFLNPLVTEFSDPSVNIVDWIVTNPPFRTKAVPFVTQALAIARKGVAMFVRSQWAVEGIERYEAVFRDRPPTLCAWFVERVNLCKGRWDPDGTTATAYCWLLWISGSSPRPPFWIPPGCREALTQREDRIRFTAHPVTRKIGYPNGVNTGCP